MATQMNVAELSAEMVGLAFVKEFYRRLHSSPQMVHGFYNDGSTMTRPDSTGRPVTVTTTKAINDLILSLDCDKFRAEIVAVDTQASHMGGLSVLVTGYLTGLDKVRRLFVESFFLAPQETGYFVLTDTFWFTGYCTAADSEKEQRTDEITAVVEETAEVAHSSLENHTAAAVDEIVETAAVEEIVETNAFEEVVETTAVKETTLALNKIRSLFRAILFR